MPIESYLKKHPDTRYLDLFYADLSGVIRGKRYPVESAQKVFDAGVMMPGGSFLLAANGECMDPEGMGFSDGDPNELCMPLAQTLAPAPWMQFPTAQAMLSMQSLNGEPYYFEPRNVLARVLEKFAAQNLRACAAFELEFYLLEPTPPGEALRAARAQRTTQVYGMEEVEDFSAVFDDMLQCMRAQRIQAGAISAEYAPGQFEINLHHSDDLLRAADECVMFKRALRGVAKKHGLLATFMPKPFAEQHPEFSGSGMHLHVNLLDAHGENAFADESLLMHAIGGLLETMPDFMAVFAPAANSYARFAPNIYVPVSKSWAHENRSVAVRIPKSRANALRIEHRIAGADANPYLTLAAVLAGMHDGVTRRIDPGAAHQGNAGEALDPSLPFDADAAFAACRASEIAAEYFGARYIRAYTACKQNEYRALLERKINPADWYL